MKANVNKKDWIDWLKSKGLSTRSIQDYAYYFDKFNFDNVTSKSVVQFVNKFNANPVVKAFVRNTFHFIRTNEYPKELKVHISEIEIPKRTGTKKRRILEILTLKEVEAVSDYMKNERDSLMVLVTYYGGLRLGELLSLSPYNFLWDKWLENTDDSGDLRVIGKGDKERIVWIPAFVMARLHKWILDVVSKKQKKDDPLFKIHERQWQKILKTAGYKAINKEINPHKLRHSIASYLETKGFSLKEIQEYLGHENIQTTQIYVHINKEKLRNKIKVLFN